MDKMNRKIIPWEIRLKDRQIPGRGVCRMMKYIFIYWPGSYGLAWSSSANIRVFGYNKTGICCPG
jgi:hypothetical protein